MKRFLLAASFVFGVLCATGFVSPVAPQGEQSLPSAPSGSAFETPRRLLQQGKNDEALAQLNQIAAENPNLKGLSREFGVAYYKTGDYLKAIDSLQKAVAEARTTRKPSSCSACPTTWRAALLTRSRF